MGIIVQILCLIFFPLLSLFLNDHIYRALLPLITLGLTRERDCKRFLLNAGGDLSTLRFIHTVDNYVAFIYTYFSDVNSWHTALKKNQRRRALQLRKPHEDLAQFYED